MNPDHTESREIETSLKFGMLHWSSTQTFYVISLQTKTKRRKGIAIGICMRLSNWPPSKVPWNMRKKKRFRYSPWTLDLDQPSHLQKKTNHQSIPGWPITITTTQMCFFHRLSGRSCFMIPQLKLIGKQRCKLRIHPLSNTERRICVLQFYTTGNK